MESVCNLATKLIFLGLGASFDSLVVRFLRYEDKGLLDPWCIVALLWFSLECGFFLVAVSRVPSRSVRVQLFGCSLEITGDYSFCSSSIASLFQCDKIF